MKPSEISSALKLMYRIDRPAFVWGKSGVGKSDVVRQLSADLGVRLIDFRAALRDPVDLMGIPTVTNGMTTYNPPAELPRDGEGILFLDELNSAKPDTMAALYQLTLDRRIGSYELPQGWRIFAAGNGVNDRGVTYRMPAPLANRFAHLQFETSLADWCAWAATHSIRVEVIAFLRFRPELLHTFDPAATGAAFASPRSWQVVSEILDESSKAPIGIEHEIYKGTVGEGAAAEFGGFLRVFREMPSPDAVLMDPAGSMVPTGPSVLFALTTALARRATEANFDRVVTYLNRLPAEYAANTIHDAIRLCPAVQHTAAFTTWAAAHGTLI